jgi:hypothetical protein
MNGKRTPGRSLDEWLELVTSCRQSGCKFCSNGTPILKSAVHSF